jgi:hypothetical protein
MEGGRESYILLASDRRLAQPVTAELKLLLLHDS